MEIGGKRIDNAAIAVACELSQLDYLTIYAPSSVGDDYIESISKLTQLTHLGLGGLPITDGAATNLGKLNTLLVLWVGGTRLTDASVPELCKLQGLTFLDISGTRITSTGLNTLQTALPNSDIRSSISQD